VKTLAGLAAVALILGLLWAVPPRHAAAPRLSIEPAQIAADGNDTATLTIEAPGTTPPVITVLPAHAATVAEISPTVRGFQATIRAGVTPTTITLRVAFPNAPSAGVLLTTQFDPTDSAGDGTPDFLRLDSASDRRAFRGWFTFLSEIQFF